MFLRVLVALLVCHCAVINGLLTPLNSNKCSLKSSPHSFALCSSKLDDNNVNVFAKPTPESSAPVIATTALPSQSSQTETQAETERVVNLDSVSKKTDFQSFEPKVDLSNLYVQSERKAPRQAGWFPMLLSPPSLDGRLAGDVGFDPLGFGGDGKESLDKMREAEIKHARLAMLAAIGWPMSELYHRQIANTLGLESILASQDKAPSVLNGGLINQWIIGAGIASLLIGAVLEFSTFQKQKQPGYKPGALGFDPLNLYAVRAKFGLDVITEKLTKEEKEARARFEMETSEIKHGRAAMLGITAFALQEFLSGIPVVEQTPFFFGDPII